MTRATHGATDAQVELIAIDFAARVRAFVGLPAYLEIRRLNATPRYSNGLCASHEFCDSDVLMEYATDSVMGFSALDEYRRAEVCALMADAFDAAAKYLTQKGV